MLRRRATRSLWLGLALAGAFGTRIAHAEPAPAPAAPPPASPPAESSAPVLAGLTVLATGGYGASTHEVRGMGLAPYGAIFGLDAGFTFPFGLRLGAYGGFSLGRTTDEHHDPIVRRAFDFEADTSSVNAGLALGWDVPVYRLVLRYGLGLGVTSMKWDFGGVDADDVRYGDAKNPNVGLHFVPGAALLWPHGHFIGGVGFDYLVHINGTIPSAFVGKALVGVKL